MKKREELIKEIKTIRENWDLDKKRLDRIASEWVASTLDGPTERGTARVIPLEASKGIAEIILAKRDLQTGRAWLGYCLQEVGEAYPYLKGLDTSTPFIDEPADVNTDGIRK